MYEIYLAATDKQPVFRYATHKALTKKLDSLASCNNLLRVYVYVSHWKDPIKRWQVVEFHHDGCLWEAIPICEFDWYVISGDSKRVVREAIWTL